MFSTNHPPNTSSSLMEALKTCPLSNVHVDKDLIKGKDFLIARNSWISSNIQENISNPSIKLTVKDLWFRVLKIMSMDVIGTFLQTKDLFNNCLCYDLSCFMISRVDWMIDSLLTILNSITIPSSYEIGISFTLSDLIQFWKDFKVLDEELIKVCSIRTSFLIEQTFSTIYFRLIVHETIRNLRIYDNVIIDDRNIFTTGGIIMNEKLKKICHILEKNLFEERCTILFRRDKNFIEKDWKIIKNSIIHLLQDDPPSLDLWIEKISPFLEDRLKEFLIN